MREKIIFVATLRVRFDALCRLEKVWKLLQVIAQRVRKPYATHYGRGLLSSFAITGFPEPFQPK